MKKETRRRQVERKIIEYFIQGKSERWIKEQLSVGNGRLRRIKRLAKELGYFSGNPLPIFPEAVLPDQIGRASCRERVCQYV